MKCPKKLSSVLFSNKQVVTRRVRLQLSIATKKQAIILYRLVRDVVSKRLYHEILSKYIVVQETTK